MELLNNILNNQWVINIGTGLLVYIITTIISNFILNKAANKEKQKQIDNANKEIIRVLKPYVVEKDILRDETINSIIESVSRKYDLSVKEVFNTKEICEELVREILESAYVDNLKKGEYIGYLNEIIEKNKRYNEMKESIEVLADSKTNFKKYKSLYNIASLCMMTIVLIISIIVTVFSEYSEKEYRLWASLSEPVQIAILVIIAEFGMMIPILFISLRNKQIRKEKKNEIDIKIERRKK